MQTTLVLVKPDGVQRGLMGRIVQRFEDKGLQVVGMKFQKAPRALLEQHYAVHKERPFYESLVSFMGSAPVLAIALRGEDAIAVVRSIMGATDGKKSPGGTIRGDFGMSVSYNLVHGSDGEETAASELALWFADGLVDWDAHGGRWIYDPEG